MISLSQSMEPHPLFLPPGSSDYRRKDHSAIVLYLTWLSSTVSCLYLTVLDCLVFVIVFNPIHLKASPLIISLHKVSREQHNPGGGGFFVVDLVLIKQINRGSPSPKLWKQLYSLTGTTVVAQFCYPIQLCTVCSPVLSRTCCSVLQSPENTYDQEGPEFEPQPGPTQPDPIIIIYLL